MLSLIAPNGFVRQWSLVNGEPRCLLDPIDPLDPNAGSAYGRSLYINDLLERDAAYPPPPPTPAEGEEPDPDWTPPEMDADVALLRRVRSGPQPVENEDGSITEDETYEADVQTLADLVEAAEPVDPPVMPPNIISDRQFSEGLWRRGTVTAEEHLAFVKTGTLPTALQAFIDAIPDIGTRVQVEGLVSGAKEFRRDHPLVSVIGAAFGFDARGLDVFWAECARL